ncbi:MAG: PaaI family thioesterase [Alphaproteobacteria bacterium]|nr:PaaI family thioesterase [Alphaproteobacteria bacterium]
MEEAEKGAFVPKITIQEFDELMAQEMPWAVEAGMALEAIGPDHAAMRLPFNDVMLRPGGTVSGPTMMALADATMYAVVLGAIGIVKLAVTTSFNINFLYRPSPADLLAEGRLLKIGKRLAVIEVTLHSEGHGEPVAHATGTYSIPPSGD